jgi:hypothetical protein
MEVGVGGGGQGSLTLGRCWRASPTLFLVFWGESGATVGFPFPRLWKKSIVSSTGDRGSLSCTQPPAPRLGSLGG